MSLLPGAGSRGRAAVDNTRIFPASIGEIVNRVRDVAARVVDRWSPRLRIGVAVDQTSVRAVGVRFGRVLWGLETPRPNNDTVDDALVACLGSRPGRRAFIGGVLLPTVTVALGPAHAQTKRLVGLPPLADPRLLARTVREHVGRFFLKNGVPLVTTTVRSDGPDGAWAAAFEQPVVVSLRNACDRSRVALRAVVPAVDVLSLGLVALYNETLIWPDGDTAVEVAWSAGRLTGVRRAAPVPGSTQLHAVPVPELASLGEGAWRFAAAYGAAIGSGPAASHTSEVLAYRPDGSTRDVARPPASQRRTITAAGAAMLALTAAALAPGVAAHRAERQATAQLAVLAPRETQALAVSRDLVLVTSALGQVAAFAASARVPTLLLRDLANALPTGAALLAMHLDSLGGSIVAIAPRAGAVVTPLDHIAWLASPEIIGPVTREKADGRDLERVTVRFRWAWTGAQAISSRAERSGRS
jgi:hypothetical protein